MSGTYIIADAGVNHNGNRDLAFKLVDVAKKYNLAYPVKAKSIAKALGLNMREIVSSTDELLSSINVSSFIEDWNSGMTLVDLANKYNFAYPDKAKRLAKTLGLVAGARTTRIDESVDKDKFIEMYHDEKNSINTNYFPSAELFMERNYLYKKIFDFFPKYKYQIQKYYMQNPKKS